MFFNQEYVKRWVSLQLWGCNDFFADTDKAIGVERDNKLIAGVVFTHFGTDEKNRIRMCEMSIASVDKKWCSRHTLKTIFAYPFIQLDLERVQAITSIHNDGANLMLDRLGFIKEGEHRKAWADGSNAYSWGMLNNECRWIA